MKRAKSVFPVFLLLVVISVLILFFFQGILIKPLQTMTLPIQSWMFGTFAQVSTSSGSVEELQEQNNELRKQLAKMRELERDNKALHDQFQTTNPVAKDLLPARVIGVHEDQVMIDKGVDDQVDVGDIVVLKDNLVGKIDKSSPHVSVVKLITHSTTSFTAETAKTTAIGVVKSQGGDSITLENVVLSDKLEKDDLVVTKGDVDERGGGFPPDLVVGKIISVNKKDSNLFQSAQIKSLVDFNKIRMVFVVTNR
jgi:rod shape-determining protein MreC